jgi:LytS/YehU family sensor histidine kinase
VITGHAFRPDVIAVAWFWVAVIGIDLVNDWLIAGVVNGFRPVLDVAGELAVWWCGWVAFSPLVVAASRRLVRDDAGPGRYALAFVTMGLAFVPVHVLLTAGLFRLTGSQAAFMGMVTHYATTYTLSEALTYAGLIGACILPLLWERRRGDDVAARAVEIRASHADRLEADARLSLMRRELDAHLLINALTNAAGAVQVQRRDHAVATLARIGDLVRAGLEEVESREVSVDREIALLECYLEIERSRHGDGLSVDYDVAVDARSALVPPFVLQPLVENAIRHGRATCPSVSVCVRRAGDATELIVRNPVPSGTKRRIRERTGLANTRRRLAHLYGSTATLELELNHGMMTATVRVPACGSSGRRV